ncbi:MAG TPA: PP2C family protein-serine/threonine phosphatase [Bacteroidia bacterium]|nr:PP2C family protein-serine/threonine phosphatase [Bacteroidia bacterium]
MANLIQRITDPEIFASLPFKERQKRRLFNRGALAGSFFCLFFTVSGLATGLNKLAFLTTFDMVALLSGIVMNHAGLFKIARHVCINASVILFVGANYFYGSIVHTEIYLFMFPVIVVFMFDDKRWIIGYCTYLISLFMLCLYLQIHFTGTYDGDVTIARKITYLNYIFSFSMLAAIVYSFKSENLEYSQQIAEQKQAIEEKSKEITDSINYAKRIQDSLLTPYEVIAKYMDRHFLFYHPKDIVSGDFYWMSPISNSEVLFAIGDCTGHGVPGAFVSSVCISKLNEAAAKTVSPGKILEDVNREIKINFGQTGNENIRDGMDIVICHFNIETRKLKYAGANRPLWILKNGNVPAENAFVEIKPDKISIGGFTEGSQLFAEHEIQTETGDTLYLFTDGYADQFGGVNGKKMTTKRFREWVMNNNHLPIREMGDKLSGSYTDWKGKHEQIDDVTVLAIRV